MNAPPLKLYVAIRVDEGPRPGRLGEGFTGCQRGACSQCGAAVWLTSNAQERTVVCWACHG